MNSTNWPAPNVWVFIAQMAEHFSANARFLMSTGLIHKRSQLARAHVFEAVWWVPWPFVPDTPLTTVRLFRATGVYFVLKCKYGVIQDTAKGVKEAGRRAGGGGTNKLAPQLFMSFTYFLFFLFTLRNRLKINKWAKIIIQAFRNMYDVRSTLIFFRRPIVFCSKVISFKCFCYMIATWLLLSTAFASPKPTYSTVNSTSPLKVEVRAQNVAKIHLVYRWQRFWAYLLGDSFGKRMDHIRILMKIMICIIWKKIIAVIDATFAIAKRKH